MHNMIAEMIIALAEHQSSDSEFVVQLLAKPPGKWRKGTKLDMITISVKQVDVSSCGHCIYEMQKLHSRDEVGDCITCKGTALQLRYELTKLLSKVKLVDFAVHSPFYSVINHV